MGRKRRAGLASEPASAATKAAELSSHLLTFSPITHLQVAGHMLAEGERVQGKYQGNIGGVNWCAPRALLMPILARRAAP